MDRQSVDRQTKHVKDVRRIASQMTELTPEQTRDWVSERQSTASIRWESCDNSYRMLFMALNRGNKYPVDKFDVRIESEESIGIDTYVRVWRDRRTNTFNAKPFTKQGAIEDHHFDTESFGGIYIYRHGTNFAGTATLVVNHDGVHPVINLERIEGKKQTIQTPQTDAIFLSALENLILPSLEDTEDTLILVWDAVLNDNLNPTLAAAVRMHGLESEK